MPSAARENLKMRLDVVDRLIEAHTLLGRRHRAALVNSGVVFLAAATEAFIKELYEEAAERIFARMSAKDFKAFIDATSKWVHGASTEKTESLYFNLGMPWAFQGISWRGFSNKTLREVWNKFLGTRNRIVHGAFIAIPIADLHRWRNMLDRFVPLLEQKVAAHIQAITHRRPPW